jgi:hypothetical protein
MAKKLITKEVKKIAHEKLKAYISKQKQSKK